MLVISSTSELLDTHGMIVSSNGDSVTTATVINVCFPVVGGEPLLQLVDLLYLVLGV